MDSRDRYPVSKIVADATIVVRLIARSTAVGPAAAE